MCRVPGTRAARPPFRARRDRGLGQPDDALGHRRVRLAGLVAGGARGGDQRVRLRSSPARAGDRCARRGCRARGQPTGGVSGVSRQVAHRARAGDCRDGPVDAVDGRGRPRRPRHRRSAAALGDGVHRPRRAQRMARALPAPARLAGVGAAGHDGRDHGLGRAPLLRPRLESGAARIRRHERPGGGRHGGGVRVLVGGDAGTGPFPGQWSRP